MATDTTNVYTGTTNFDKQLQILIRLQLEEQLRNPLPFLNDQQFIPASLVQGSNGTLRFLAIGDMAVDVSDGSALWVAVEGEPPTSEDLDFGYEEFSVRQGVRVVKLTDVALKESPLQLMSEASRKIARVIMEIHNGIAAKILMAGDNTYFVGGDSDPTTAEVRPDDVLTGLAVRTAVAVKLENENVPTFADQTYRAFISPLVKLDLTGDEDAGGWIDSRRYATPDNFLTGELGTYAGVRFIKNIIGAKLANAGSSSNDVYVTPIIGPQAFAIGDFGATETFLTPPGGHDDPAHQSALIAFKGWWGGMLLGEGTNANGPVSGPRYVNVYSGVSQSTS